MTWEPLIDDAGRKQQLLGVIREIVTAVDASPIGRRQIGELGDRALYRAYLAQDGAVEDTDDAVSTALAAAVTKFASHGAGVGLFDGAAGIGWYVEHLAGGDTATQVCTSVDLALVKQLEDWNADYDLISGLAGMGVYALERGEAGRSLATRVLEVLEKTAVEREGGAAWFTKPELLPPWQREVAPEGYWNLGLAHGIPGVIALLARYVRHGVEKDRAAALLDRAMTYMLAVQPPRDQGRYPGWLPSDRQATLRVAWCYGDLGASIAMLSAAIERKRDDWRAEAMTIATRCARTPFESAEVKDCGICHGAAGAAHLFGRVFHATREPVFRDAAVRWLDQTLAMRNDHPFAGFPSATTNEANPWEADASMLTGAPGVALVIHALISDVEPSWDRMLLVDFA